MANIEIKGLSDLIKSWKANRDEVEKNKKSLSEYADSLERLNNEYKSNTDLKKTIDLEKEQQEIIESQNNRINFLFPLSSSNPLSH